MNEHLQQIIEFLGTRKDLSDEKKSKLIKSVKSVDNDLTVISFKLDRTEKVKRTTSILLEETIEELEQKRKAVEKQAHEAKIEASLERVRLKAMAMNSSTELSEAVLAVFEGLDELGFKTIRCGIGIFNDDTKKVNAWTISPKDDSTVSLSGDEVLEGHPLLDGIYNAWRNQTDYSYKLTGKDLINYYELVGDSNLPVKPPENIKIELVQNYHCVMFPAGGLYAFSENDFSEEAIGLMKKFGDVFHLAFTRHLDLKKAEAQAREAQIEAALERVRSRTMGMQKSDELPEVANVIFLQIQSLGIPTWSTSYNILSEDKKSCICIPSSEGQVQTSFHLPFEGEKSFFEWVDAVEKGNSFFVQELAGKDLEEHYNYLISLPGVQEAVEPLEKAGISLPTYQINHLCFFKHGFLMFITYEKVPEAHDIFKRFTAVFEQTYTRFLDLKKAEAQAREAQIEVALERVRSRSMAMQKSNELKEVIQLVYEQFVNLDLNIEHTGFIVDHKERDDMHIWLADQNGAPSEVTIPYFDSPHWNSFIDAKEKGIDFFVNTLNFEVKNKFYKKLFEFIPDLPAEAKEFYLGCPGLAISTVLLDNIGLYMENFSGIPYSDEENDILMRFGKVFQQTYTRFLDLQKAEEQARESKIEAALETVRSRSLAMHNSDEIKDVVLMVMEKMNELNIEMNGGVSLATYVPDSNDLIHWYVNPDHVDGPVTMHLPYFENVLFSDFIEARISGKEILHVVYSFEEKNKYFEYAFENSDFKIINEDLKKWIMEQPYFGYSVAIQNHSAIFFNDYSGKLFTEKENKVLIRFAKVFDQAYIRFLDLQKAEEQARQAQIETAMEKVRSRALAMQKPEELIEVAQVLRKEMGLLGVEELETSSIYIHDEDSGTTECWYAIQDIREDYKKLLTDYMTMHLNDTWVGREMMEFYRSSQKQTSILMQGENRKEWINYCADHSEALQGYYGDVIPERTYHLLKFSNGFIGAASPGDISAQSWELLERATSVFSFAYTRFRDLQQAEARALEAVRQASLDRVRAEIASMRSTGDLEKITPLIWRELTALGVPFFRCGIFIIDETNELVHAYLSTPEGNSLAALQIKLDKGVWVEKAVQNWRIGQMYYEVWDREKFLSWAQVMMDEGFVENKERFQDGKNAPENLSLQLLPFNQGMLYIGSEERLSEEEIELGQKLANDFGIAYSRYEDFQKLEEANNRKSVELEEARQLQLGMLPKETPKINNLEIAAYMETATEVGGDYYDFNIDEDGSLTVVVGDATGHGMKAGTIVTITKSLFNSSASDNNILETFSKISKVIKEMKFRQLSMCLLMLKIKDYKLTISSAAMPPIFIYRCKTKTVDEILIKGMPLGAISNFPYSYEETNLQKGDNILLMSDGFPELMNGDGEIFGYERTRNLFGKIGNKKPDEIISKLKDTGVKWLNGREPDDDVTFVVIKVK